MREPSGDCKSTVGLNANRRLRVLMLGWEFPPQVNGGLGVACHGLALALSDLVDLEVIVPKAAPSDEGFTLTGLNCVSVEEIVPVEHRYSYESFARVQQIPISLDPYAQSETILEQAALTLEGWDSFSKTTKRQLELFSCDEMYGDDLGLKVVEFSKVTAKLALQREFDLIHAHDWMTYLAGVEIKKATGKPLVVHLHASQYDRAGAEARGWIYDIERYGMTEADFVIPVSHYTGKILMGHYGIRAEKIVPIHNGAEAAKSFVTTKKFPEDLVLFLGRLTSQKGPEFFLEIASRVLAMNKNVRFVMAGSGEKLRSLIESGAYQGLGGKFHFTGFLDKERVQELLSMTDVYCMPSVSEPFGLSALEAAQFRIPAVISKQSGVAEVLKGALKADFWDTQLMAKHINDLLTDEELREKVINQSDADLHAATWQGAAQKVYDVYRRVLS